MAIRFPDRRRGIIVSGQEAVIANLNKEIRALDNRNRAGLAEAALIVKRESMIRTPVDTGNLKGSAFTEVISTAGRGTGAVIGYADSEIGGYALHVHENMDARHIVGQARFLATALVVKAHEVFEAIKRRATIR